MAKSEARRQAEQIKAAAAKPSTSERTAPDRKQDAAPAKPDNPYADEFKQYAWISSSEQSVKEKLRDPDSAEFRNVRFYSGAGVPVSCGEVNAKNGFGGYTGFERFVAMGPEMAYLDSEVAEGIGEVWNKFCVPGADDKAGAR
jgi:hypothetical protein